MQLKLIPFFTFFKIINHHAITGKYLEAAFLPTTSMINIIQNATEYWVSNHSELHMP